MYSLLPIVDHILASFVSYTVHYNRLLPRLAVLYYMCYGVLAPLNVCIVLHTSGEKRMNMYDSRSQLHNILCVRQHTGGRLSDNTTASVLCQCSGQANQYRLERANVKKIVKVKKEYSTYPNELIDVVFLLQKMVLAMVYSFVS